MGTNTYFSVSLASAISSRFSSTRIADQMTKSSARIHVGGSAPAKPSWGVWEAALVVVGSVDTLAVVESSTSENGLSKP